MIKTPRGRTNHRLGYMAVLKDPSLMGTALDNIQSARQSRAAELGKMPVASNSTEFTHPDRARQDVFRVGFGFRCRELACRLIPTVDTYPGARFEGPRQMRSLYLPYLYSQIRYFLSIPTTLTSKGVTQVATAFSFCQTGIGSIAQSYQSRRIQPSEL